MRVIIVLIVILVALAIIQSERNNCEWGQSGWLDCVLTFDGADEPDVSP